MALNTTLRERRQQAALDAANKVRLENTLNRELRQLFRTVGTDLRTFYATTGNIPNAVVYERDLTALLTRHYRRTSTRFKNQIIKWIKKNPGGAANSIRADLTLIAQSRGLTLTQLLEDITNNAGETMRVFTEVNVRASVSSIMATTQKDLNRAVTNAEVALTEKLGRQPTRRELAARSATNFRDISLGRVGTISVTETQKAAEGQKDSERENLLEVRDGFDAREQGLQPLNSKEIWVSMADNLVRDGPRFNHLVADFQEKENGVFTVSGQLLKFPGDTSLGATAGNIVNCRCSDIFVLED